MKKAATKHAPVTQAIRDAIHKLQTTCTQRFDVEFDGELPDPTDDELFAWLADYSAELERRAEREALIWATGAMSLNERDNAIIQRRINELEQGR